LNSIKCRAGLERADCVSGKDQARTHALQATPYTIS
jgi:hypothetical protein